MVTTSAVPRGRPHPWPHPRPHPRLRPRVVSAFLASLLIALAGASASPAAAAPGGIAVVQGRLPATGGHRGEPGARPVPGRLPPGRRAQVGWQWPVRPATLDRPFAVGPFPWSPGHRGVDLRAGTGAAVLAPAAGTVTFAGPVAGRPVLVISHAGGLRSSLEPVVSDLAPGTPVGAGVTLGHVGAPTGHCRSGHRRWSDASGGSASGSGAGGGRASGGPGECLHWGVRRGRTYLDPASLVAGSVPLVLLPLT